MIAATARRYGPPEVMRLEALPDPIPGPGQVLVAVEAFGVTRGDARIRGLDVPRGMGPMVRAVFGLTRPRRIVPGREYAGRIVGLGAGVQGWAVGEAVFGITDGMRLGAGAERVAVRADGLIFRRPPTLSAEAAAALCFGGLTAADFLIDQMQVQRGERLLILGATGAVGVAAVRIGVHLGAQVTAVASAANLEFARSLGAQAVADYRAGLPAGPFDAILDIPGALPWPAARAYLTPGGRLGLVTATLAGQIGASLWPRRGPRRGPFRLCAGVTVESRDKVARLLALVADGVLPAPPLAILRMEAIVEAHRLASSGHKRGAVVVRTGAAPQPGP